MSETPTKFVVVERALREVRTAEKALEAARKKLDGAIKDSDIKAADYSRIANVKHQTAADRIKRAHGQVTKRGYDAMYFPGATSAVKKALLARITKPAIDPVLTTEAIVTDSETAEVA